LEKGRVVESGTHAALVATRGLYYAMWRQQIGELPADPDPDLAVEPAPAEGSTL
jgi:ATP-binding cassette subfamily B protein